MQKREKNVRLPNSTRSVGSYIDQDDVCQLPMVWCVLVCIRGSQSVCGGRTKHARDSFIHHSSVLLQQFLLSSTQHKTKRAVGKHLLGSL